jgi:hypothetical protein
MGLIKGIEDKYPEEIIYKREFFEGQVIGLLAKDLLFIDECNLNLTDFKTEEGRVFFKIEQEIRNKGYNQLDEVTVLSNIPENLQDKFEEYGGYDAMANLSEIVDTKNSDSIFDALHRENIFMKLYDNGFNLLKPIKDDKGIEFVPIEKFRKLPSESVVSWYEVELNKVAVGYNTKILEEGNLNIDDEFLESLYAGDQCGVPYSSCSIDIQGEEETVYPYTTRQTKGLLRGSTTILGAYSSVGKTTWWTGLILSLLEQGEKALIFSNEQNSAVFKINVIIWLAYKHFRYYKITKSNLINGNLTDDDKSKIKEIRDYFMKKYSQSIMFIHLPDMDISTIKKKTRYYALQYGYTVSLIDTLKMDYSDGVADASYHKLIEDTRTLDSLAKRFNLIELCSFQLAPSTLGKLFLDVTCLSGAKAVKDTCENLFLMRVAYKDELDKESKKFYCSPFRRKMVEDIDENGDIKNTWITEKFEPNPDKIYRIFFIDKCRSGQNSGDSGEAMLLEFDANHSVFKEVAYCKPKRLLIQ